MEHSDLRTTINQSYKKGRLLEAALLQSAYLESVIQTYTDIQLSMLLNRASGYNDPLAVAIKNRIRRFGIDALVNFLNSATLLTKSEKSLLNEYKDARNDIVHYLLDQVSEKQFDQYLKDMYLKGEQILNNKKFASVTRFFKARSGLKFTTYSTLKGKQRSKGTASAINAVTTNEESVLRMRLEKGLNFEQIGTLLGVSRQRADQVFESGILKFSSPKSPTPVTLTVILPKSTSPEVIKNEITKQFGVTEEEILGPSRKAKWVLPRHIIMFVLNKKLKLSFPVTSKLLKRKDHTSAMHAVEQIQSLINAGRLILTEAK